MMRKDLKVGDIFGHGWSSPFYIVVDEYVPGSSSDLFCKMIGKREPDVSWTGPNSDCDVIDLQTALQYYKMTEPAEWMLKYLQPQFEYEYVDGF